MPSFWVKTGSTDQTARAFDAYNTRTPPAGPTGSLGGWQSEAMAYADGSGSFGGAKRSQILCSAQCST